MNTRDISDYLRAKQDVFDKLYDSLNEKQREAVYTVNGPLLVLAGAGTGKTTVLVQRIAHIIRYGNVYQDQTVPDSPEIAARELKSALTLSREELASVADGICGVSPTPPWTILAITFTNKAAREIKDRLVQTVGQKGEEVVSGTFHSVCLRILRRYGDRVGYRPGFTIFDAEDSKKLISDCIKQLNIDDKQLVPKSVANAISRAKDRLLTPELYSREVGNDFRLSQIANIYELYQKRLKDDN
ncbi:MAG: UvrD-helicase domain-containing protein, partial [Candidatus Methanomethylophilaceae archaeon]|nr:UvrD-helicase domain-containing protein [Candidatus Methanomethylophilaceae archaeon]